MKNRRHTQKSAAALVSIAVFIVAGFLLDDPRRRFIPFAATMLGAGASWAALLTLTRHKDLSRTLFLVGIGIGAVLRIWALDLSPAFSDDVFRYVYEGRVVWSEGLGFPFAHAPSDAPLLGVDPALLDRTWLRINHPELSTIYPPFAQLVFLLAGGLADGVGGDPLTWLKSALVLADVGTAVVLYRVGRAPAALAWWLCPLVIVEIAREGHADSLSALGLALVVLGFLRSRPRLGFGGAVLAALAKLNGLFVLPVALRATRRGSLVLLLLVLLALPYLLAGTHASEGIGAYASRWRAGDGLFSVFLELAEFVLGGDWRQIGDTIVTRHQLARGITGVVFVFIVLLTIRKRPTLADVPAKSGLLILALLLLAPTFHPWYVTWLLPFVVAPNFVGRRAVLYLAVTSPLLHHAGWLELVDGVWSERVWVRAAVHGPALAWLAWDLVRGPILGYPAGHATGGGAADRDEGGRRGAHGEPVRSAPRRIGDLPDVGE